MATIKELIRTEAAGGISFGNYELGRAFATMVSCVKG